MHTHATSEWASERANERAAATSHPSTQPATKPATKQAVSDLNRGVAAVLEKVRRLVLVHVKAGLANHAGPQAFDEGLGVNESCREGNETRGAR